MPRYNSDLSYGSTLAVFDEAISQTKTVTAPIDCESEES